MRAAEVYYNGELAGVLMENPAMNTGSGMMIMVHQ